MYWSCVGQTYECSDHVTLTSVGSWRRNVNLLSLIEYDLRSAHRVNTWLKKKCSTKIQLLIP